MPYILEHLPYGLRCRLHDLAYPLERYEIQIAAGNPFFYPRIQYVQKTDSLFKLLNVDETPILYNQPRYQASTPAVFDDKSLVCAKRFMFNKISLQHLSSETFQNLLIQPDAELVFWDCELSLDFFKTLKSFSVRSPLVQCFNSHRFKYTTDFADLLATFPEIETLRIGGDSAVKTWLTDLLPFSGQLSVLQFFGCKECLVDITSDKLVTFLEAQKPGFRLIIETMEMSGEEIQDLMRGLSNRLEKVKFEELKDAPLVTLNSVFEEHKAMYRLPLIL